MTDRRFVPRADRSYPRRPVLHGGARRLAVLVWALIGTMPLWAQSGAVPANEALPYSFETIGPKTGLTQADIITALQTRDGYLWFGTAGGLARFDGVRFVSFRLSNTPAFLNHLVNCLFEDREGNLWIGSERGAIRYRHGVFERVGPEDASIRTIAQDPTGRVWLGTFGAGLYAFAHEQLQRFDREPALLSAFVSSLVVDATGRLWIGFQRATGVVYFENERFQRYDADGKLSGEIQAIAENPRGTLWFGSRRDGLFRLKNGKVSAFTTRDGLVNSQVYELRPARDGGLWVMSDVLQKTTPGERFAIHTVAARLSDRPGTVCEDHEGGAWICGRSSGLVYARQIPYRLVTTDDGLPGNAIKSVTADRDGATWLSVQRAGVVKLTSDGAVTVYAMKDGLPTNDPDAIFAASDGRIWAGSVRGLSVFQNGAWQSLPAISGVGSLFESRDGTMWVGTSRGDVYEGKNGELTRVDLGLSKNLPIITSFCEAADGTIYIGTWNDGVMRLAHGKTQVLNRDNGLPSNEVRALYTDSAGRIWVGMRGRGLAVLDGVEWLNANILAEAVGDQVNAIAEDDQGQLWLGTPAGVLWAPIDRLLAAARGQGAMPDLRIAEISDSRPSIAVRSGRQPVVWRTQNRELLFGTRQGLFEVDPHHLALNSIPPPVQIERLALDGHTASATPDARVPAGTREISLDYTALSFVRASRVLFKYKVEGYDSDWVEAGTRRTAIYTNLPPRHYLFRVKACNSDGVWNETGAALAFTVAPFFWQTWWFAAGALALFTGTTVAVARYLSFRRLQLTVKTLAQQAALDKERARIARDIHDDIGNRLTKIMLLSGLAARARAVADPAGGHLAQIGATVRQVIDSLDEIVWAVNPRNDTLPHLIDYLAQFAVEFLQTAGIRCRVDLPDHPPHRTVSTEARHNLFLVVKEAINNVVRHSHASEVTLQIALDPTDLRVVLADNGRGFSPEPEAPGADGLRNMRQRMTEIGGTFHLTSRADAGTQIVLTFPWPAE